MNKYNIQRPSQRQDDKIRPKTPDAISKNNVYEVKRNELPSNKSSNKNINQVNNQYKNYNPIDNPYLNKK